MKQAKRVGLVVAVVVGSITALPGISTAAPRETFTYVCEDSSGSTFERTMPVQARAGIERSIENYNAHNNQGETCYIVE